MWALMSKRHDEKAKHLGQAIIGGLIAMLLSPVLGFLAWPMIIFDPLFPPDCPPETFICFWSEKAIIATLVTEFIIYTLIIYLILRLGLIHLKRTSYIGKV